MFILLILHFNHIIVCDSDLFQTMLLQLLLKNVNINTVHMKNKAMLILSLLLQVLLKYWTDKLYW